MENLIGNIVNIIFVLLGATIWVGILIRIFRDRLCKTTEAAAIVVNKQCFEKQTFSKSWAPTSNKKYVVTFLVGDKKLHFDVSEFSYKGYRINERGTLKYKGSRLIDFK